MGISFHDAHLDTVELSNDNLKAEKSSFFKSAAVFSCRPLLEIDILFFRVRKNTPNEFKKAFVGLTCEDPSTLNHDSDLRYIPEVCQGKILSIDTGEADIKQCSRNWHCVHISQGTFYYGVNGIPHSSLEGVATKNISTWLFLALGSLSEVELIDCPVKADVIESYKRLLDGQRKSFKSVMSTVSVMGGPSKIPGFPMVFHKVANDMAVTNHSRSIEALDVHASVAFSSKPFSENQCLSMEVENSGSVCLGLTTKDPDSRTSSDLTKQFTHDQFGPIDTCLIGQIQFCMGDIIHLAVVRQRGKLVALAGKNGEAKGTIALRNRKYWMVIRPQSVSRISILECTHLDETPSPEPNDLHTKHEPEEVPRRDIHSPVRISPETPNRNEYTENAHPTTPKKQVVFVTPSKEGTNKEVATSNEKHSSEDVPLGMEKAHEKRHCTNDSNESFKDEDNLYRPQTQSVFEKIYRRDLTEIRKLGSGAQGDVKLVSTPLLGKMAAKFFSRSLSRTAAKYEDRELAIMGRLHSHRFIISIHGFIFENELSPRPLGYLMEVMENGSLHQAIHDVHTVDGQRKYKVKYDKPHIYNWIQQAASAFNFMHGAGVLHRDIKPLNLLLSNDYEQLRVCDLGLSGEISLEMTMRIGTYIYMAPEVLALASGKPSNKDTYDSKCDVYSLAITIWELIHRRQPYSQERDPPMTVMRKICTEAYRPHFKPNSSPTLSEMVKTGWSEKPDARPKMEDICRLAHRKLTEIEKSSNISLRIRPDH